MKRPLLSLFSVLIVFISILTGCATGTGKAPSTSLDYMAGNIEKTSDFVFSTEPGIQRESDYPLFNWTSVAGSLPSHFDLRETGTVTVAKDQSPWATCWAFSTIAASESSILNSLGMTTDQFLQQYGKDFDLSERHLIWFSIQALPEPEDYPEGEYPFDETQAGEGIYSLDEYNDAHPFELGGSFTMSSASLAAGIGILSEEFAPYTDNDGTLKKDGDWSLPQEDRFIRSYALKNANILPDIYIADNQGNMFYSQKAIEILKSEIFAGNAVAIGVYSDYATPEMTKGEKREYLRKLLLENRPDDVTDEELEYYLDIRVGEIDKADLSSEELRNLIRFRLRINYMPEDFYDVDSLDHDMLAMVFDSSYFGLSVEEIEVYENREPYMVFVGKDPAIYAQYVCDELTSNHAVTLVGWDDSFPAENWPEGRRPPADGAWIAKNSWGRDWGNDGFFLLSYYDKTICGLHSFDYIVDYQESNQESLKVLAHDLMPATILNETSFDKPVYGASVFTVDEDCCLQYVSAITGTLKNTLTACIYLLDEDATDPTRGTLLQSTSETFPFAGYHLLKLGRIPLKKGSRIGVVIEDTVPTESGIKHSIFISCNYNEQGALLYNETRGETGDFMPYYGKAKINRGESYICLDDGIWMDWVDAVDYISSVGNNRYLSFDNLPIKAYLTADNAGIQQ